MELTELESEILTLAGETARHEVLEFFKQNLHDNVYPFNNYQDALACLLSQKIINYRDYKNIKERYISKNPNLWIFEELTAPRVFGSFAEKYIQGKSIFLQKPSRKIDPNFTGEYDLILDSRIKIEVKASRATDTQIERPLYIKALSSKTHQPFWMNFQQLKPQCCDVFIWLAVFRDEISIWILGSQEVMFSPYYSRGQHRGNAGNEGQLHLKNDNIGFFDHYKLKDDDILRAIRCAAQKSACISPLY